MKRHFMFFILAACSVIFTPEVTYADVIIPSSSDDLGLSTSFEILLSLEKQISNRAGVLLWGGIGVITTCLPDPFEEANYGSEIAVEIRDYFARPALRGGFVGVYSGFGFMHHIDGDDRSINNTGVKIGYKSIQNEFGFLGSILEIEPYISLGIATELDNDFKYIGPWINIGLRLALEF